MIVEKEFNLIVGQIVKAKRLKKKITQQDLANLLEVSRQTLCAIESGTQKMSFAYFVGLVKLKIVTFNSMHVALKERGVYCELSEQLT